MNTFHDIARSCCVIASPEDLKLAQDLKHKLRQHYAQEAAARLSERNLDDEESMWRS